MLECVDFFCGAGGLSLGFHQAQIKLQMALDSSPECATTYRKNFPSVRFCQKSIQEISASEVLSFVHDRDQLIVAGGPPCQLFSRLNRHGASMSPEIKAYVRLVKEIRPRFVVLENVPAILKRKAAWNLITECFRDMKYDVAFSILRATDFGVPQNRERLILIAGRTGVCLPIGACTKVSTVRDAIGHLPNADSMIPNHVGMKLSAANLHRIRGISQGDNSRTRSSPFRDSYSRMHWDRPAPTITTKCISFSNGRFGHPEYDRALTIREAAILQGFPNQFVFVGNLWDCARQVGNAVPPPVARSIGLQLVALAKPARRRRVA